MPIVLFSEDIFLIVEKVAAQLGICPHQAAAQMGIWDRIAVETFCLGNDYPRGELH
jgi:hypothetical protein